MTAVSKPGRAIWEVPFFKTAEFFPKKTKYCICVPVINEGERIRKQLQDMAPLAHQADIIIGDGGSTDGSVEKAFLRSVSVRTLLEIKREKSSFLGGQMRALLAYAVKESYDGFVFIDGNDKDDSSAIPDFIRLLDEGYDHIQGSRFIPGGKSIGLIWYRYLGIRLIHAPLISLAARFRYTDTTNGFRAYSRKFILDSEVNPFRNAFSGYGLHYYLAIRAAQLGYRIIEMPVTRRYPKGGAMPTKISFIKGNFEVLKTLIKCCLRLYDEV